MLGREQRVAGSRRRRRRASRECAEAARSSRWLGAERRKELRAEHAEASCTPASLQGWARRPEARSSGARQGRRSGGAAKRRRAGDGRGAAA